MFPKNTMGTNLVPSCPRIKHKLVNINAQTPRLDGRFEETALHIATKEGNLEVLKVLINAHADLNAKQGGNKWTALHVAAFRGEIDCLKELIKVGADLNAKNNVGETPLHLSKHNINCMMALIKAGADVTAKDDRGRIALFYCDPPKHTYN
jgi:ankyrin repeat protein